LIIRGVLAAEATFLGESPFAFHLRLIKDQLIKKKHHLAFFWDDDHSGCVVLSGFASDARSRSDRSDSTGGLDFRHHAQAKDDYSDM